LHVLAPHDRRRYCGFAADALRRSVYRSRSVPASPTATPDHIKDVNTRYHDAAADEYDAKWGIDFGATGQRQVRLKLAKALDDGVEGLHFPDALEIGSGTGYFSLNLLQMGTIERLTATDISPGMLRRLSETAEDLGLEIETVATEAEELPFEDESFDLVFGHAVLHHIPDLAQAFAEFRRVLRPGGAIAFCGEPSRYGDRLATAPKRAGLLVAPLWRRLVGACERTVPEMEQSNGHALEGEVDVHAFAPADLRRLLRDTGFEQQRVGGEELLANAWGWGLRTVEASAEPESVSWSWRRFAFNSYIALQKVDTRLLEPRLPAELFYNLLLSGRKPA
jgi:ubiquinone/menaquinone biosynthesis C-methylase UbiE